MKESGMVVTKETEENYNMTQKGKVTEGLGCVYV